MLSPIYTALIAELQAISPMPDEDVLNMLPYEDDRLDRLARIITMLKQETQTDYPLELIEPLLDVFGTGTGNGVFWGILHLIETYPHLEEVYPVIRQATRSSNPGTRQWSCQLLGRRREREDEPFFLERLQDPVGSVRWLALTGIVMLSQCFVLDHLLPVIEPFLQDEDSDVAHTAKDAIESIKASAQE